MLQTIFARILQNADTFCEFFQARCLSFSRLINKTFGLHAWFCMFWLHVSLRNEEKNERPIIFLLEKRNNNLKFFILCPVVKKAFEPIKGKVVITDFGMLLGDISETKRDYHNQRSRPILSLETFNAHWNSRDIYTFKWTKWNMMTTQSIENENA